MDINWQSMVLKHKITITPSSIPVRTFIVNCECGNLYVPVTEEEMGTIIRIHWDVVNQISDAVIIPWCTPDGCPSDICGGPHYKHLCKEGKIVVGLSLEPCVFCDWVLNKKE